MPVAAMMALLSGPVLAAELTLDSAPPVVVRTEPIAGATGVDPRTSEIVVQFSKPMRNGSWAWSKWQEENFPDTISNKPPHLTGDRTCVLPVKLQPGTSYALWLHTDAVKGGFKDTNGTAAVPYLLTFATLPTNASPPRFAQRLQSIVARAPARPDTDPDLQPLLNDDQKAVLAWTDRQFRSFFDSRTFDGWSADERATLEKRLIDALNGPRSTEYYQAINTLAAMRSTSAPPRLREIAFERVDRNNRDRWMAVRALGLIGDKSAVPDVIHLVYHGNPNTRWWAQITLVRLTGKNFGGDWDAWGKSWNESGGQPPFKPVIIRWWNGQAEPDKLAESLAESDRKFLADTGGNSASLPTQTSSAEASVRLRTAAPLMEAIRGSWTAAVEAIQRNDTTNALAALQALTPRIQDFRNLMKGTTLEAGTADALEKLKPLISALEQGDLRATQPAMAAMAALGQNMEAQVKAITDTPLPAKPTGN